MELLSSDKVPLSTIITVAKQNGHDEDLVQEAYDWYVKREQKRKSQISDLNATAKPRVLLHHYIGLLEDAYEDNHGEGSLSFSYDYHRMSFPEDMLLTVKRKRTVLTPTSELPLVKRVLAAITGKRYVVQTKKQTVAQIEFDNIYRRAEVHLYDRDFFDTVADALLKPDLRQYRWGQKVEYGFR